MKLGFYSFIIMNSFACLSIMASDADARTLIELSQKASDRKAFDAQRFIKSLSNHTQRAKIYIEKVTIKHSDKGCASKKLDGNNNSKCQTSYRSEVDAKKSSAQLLIFVSTSMPKDSIKILGQEAHKIGARVVFRGLVRGTFKETQSYIQDLGIIADIDPPKFEDYKVNQIPTFILTDASRYDRISGHISIWEALEQFKRKGELKDEARKLYDQLKQRGVHGANS